MIIGRGDIASVLPDRDDLLFFASGVSNSSEMREEEYEREIKLLKEKNTDKHIVYFSSLSIFYLESRYTKHKMQMEALIKNRFPIYTIIRLGNITWGKNPHTLINYLKNNPKAEIRDVYRYVVDKDEFLHWINLIPSFSCEMNITGRRMKVEEIKEKYANA